MNNPLAGFWSSFLTDPKYSLIRHAVISGAAVFAVAVLQAVTQTNFGDWNILIVAVAGFAIRWLSSFTS